MVPHGNSREGVVMKFKEFLLSFERLLAESPREKLEAGVPYVFLSDLHLGDGSSRDDLAPNRGIVMNSLSRWYLDRGFVLVLNGDIEDLTKLKYKEIMNSWAGLYDILDAFAAKGRLRRILGNHDLDLLRRDDYPYDLLHSLALEWKGKTLLAFHGHQASRFFMNHDYLSEIIVRYLAKPLAIRNTSVSRDSTYRFKTERLIYRASRRFRIVSITGHTHRPLFESLSKYDCLRWAIEDALREYTRVDEASRRVIAEKIASYRHEIRRLRKREIDLRLSRSLYEERDLLIPSLFNSGCGTGKHGITAIEIQGGGISLVQWTGAKGPRDYVERESLRSEALPNSPYSRYTLRSALLDEVFARVELLGNRVD